MNYNIVSISHISNTSEYHHYIGLLNHLKELDSLARLYKQQYSCMYVDKQTLKHQISNPIYIKYEQYCAQVITKKLDCIIDSLDRIIYKLQTSIKQIECLVNNYRLTLLHT